MQQRVIGLVVVLLTVVGGCQGNKDPLPAVPPPAPARPSVDAAQSRLAASEGNRSKHQRSSTNETVPTVPAAELMRLAPGQSHQRMIEELQRIAARLGDENGYLGDLQARELRNSIDRLPSEAANLDRAALFNNLGNAELRLGREHQAIDDLTKAIEWLTTAAGPPELIRDAHVQLAFELGVAYMRLAETENCCQRNTPESCIFPIAGEGIHQNQQPARQAIENFSTSLTNSAVGSETHLRARWLLNIAYMTIGEYPAGVPQEYLIAPAAFASDISFPRFTNISSQLSLDSFSMCGGAVADDFDGDNLLDLFVSSWDPSAQLRFFHNNGDGTFEDRTEHAQLAGISGGLNLVQADYNNDGHVDLLVLRGAWFASAGLHPNSLLRNEGNGTFTDVTFSAGLGDVHYPTQTASWADYDNDGFLDLYIGNEHGRGVTAPCQLFQNQRDGTFQDVARSAGVANHRFAKAVIWGDYDHDRWPDLFVSNQFDQNRLYRNLGNGTFVDVAPQLGLTEPLNSFPAWFFDVDNDGALDLFVSCYDNQAEDIAAAYLGSVDPAKFDRLFRNNGQGGFDQVGQQWNLNRPTAPMGSNFGDLNGDGFLDFYLGTGDPAYFNLMPNVMYLNRDGKQFVDVTMAGGFGHLQKGHAVVFADLDNDGDQDVFEQLGGAFPGDKFFDALFQNPGFGCHWLTVQLVGIESNRSAIGARIRIDVTEGGSSRSIYKHVNSGGTFGGNPLRQTIGLGRAERIDRVEIFWPKTGQTQTLENIPMDTALRITEGETVFTKLDLLPFQFTSTGT